MSAKSYVPSSGRMYFVAIASTWFRRSRANAFSWSCALIVGLRVGEALEVVERELRVDRHETLDVDHRVDPLAGLEAVLKLVRVLRAAGRGAGCRAAARRTPPRALGGRNACSSFLRSLARGEDLRVRLAELAQLLVDRAASSSRRSRGGGPSSPSSPPAGGRTSALRTCSRSSTDPRRLSISSRIVRTTTVPAIATAAAKPRVSKAVPIGLANGRDGVGRHRGGAPAPPRQSVYIGSSRSAR